MVAFSMHAICGHIFLSSTALMKNGTHEQISTHEQNLNKYGYRKIHSEDATLPDKYFCPSFDL
jgi:hypothetical protein